MYVAMYLRKSRAEELSDSLEETLQKHRRRLEALAQELELTVAQVYEEVVSGESLCTRLQMLQLLAHVEEGRYGAVLCMDIDRLGRGGMADQGIIFETLKKAGTKIITPRKTYDLNNELDEEYTEFEAFIARRELKLIKRRMQRGVKASLENGGYLSNPPYGYCRAMSRKTPTLAVVEEEAAFVRMMFDLYVNQNCGCQVIAQTVTALGAVPRRGSSFSRATVRKILHNPVYIGQTVWNQNTYSKEGGRRIVSANTPEQWQITPGLHPPIISKELFEAAQKVGEQRKKAPCRSKQVQNPLAGLITCERCGFAMQRRPLPQGEHLLCPTKGCCRSTRLDRVETALLKAVYPLFSSLLVTPANCAPLEEENRLVQLRCQLDMAQKEERRLLQQENRLCDLLEQGVYTPEVFNRRRGLLREQRQALMTQKEEISQELVYLTEKKKNPEPPQTVWQIYCAAPPEGKNRLLKTVISHGRYFKEAGWQPNQFRLALFIYRLPEGNSPSPVENSRIPLENGD